MKKRLSVFIVVGIMVFSTTCFASLAEELDNNPNYIYYGGAGTGTAFFMDKSSLVVNKYEPPIYIIAFISIDYSTGLLKGRVSESVRSKTMWFKYDYDLRRMYSGRPNTDGTFSWEYINPKDVNINSAINAMVTGGEIAFYLAYNMSFYDEPVTFLTKKYINSHK